MRNKYYLWVLGCQMNEADASGIENILTGLNWQKVESENEADLIIVVACSVKQAAINSIVGKAYEWQPCRKQTGLKLILTGCVLESDQEKIKFLFDYILPIGEIEKLREIISPIDDFNIDLVGSKSNFKALIPISNGCNNFCSYCVVPYVRGEETCRSAEAIISECREAINSGIKEIILLGQNVNSYEFFSPFTKGGDRGGLKYNFPALLKKIDNMAGDYWLRFMSSHPKDLSDELLRIMATGEHIAPHLHLALQSGDNEILTKMNRRYTAEQYLEIVKQAREIIPDLSLSTDIIVGFPGETAEQFERTAKVMEELKLDMAYISPYSVRAGTVASKLADDVSAEIKKERLLKLDGILRKTALANNERYIGKTVKVLVDGEKNGKLFGKTGGNRVVSFEGGKSLIGSFAEIRIVSAKPFSLSGEIA